MAWGLEVASYRGADMADTPGKWNRRLRRNTLPNGIPAL